MEKDKVILVPSYNELASLKIICKKLKKHNLHFIILDDCSTDGTEKWLRKKLRETLENDFELMF